MRFRPLIGAKVKGKWAGRAKSGGGNGGEGGVGGGGGGEVIFNCQLQLLTLLIPIFIS